MEDMYDIINEVCVSSDNDGHVLATIVDVEGSAYKKEGASMLFKQDGAHVGMLSAGCLEEDLAARIEVGLHHTDPLVTYNMKSVDELSWGEGSGCNGVIRVLMEVVDAPLKSHLMKLKHYLELGKAVTSIKKIKCQTNENEYLFFVDSQEVFGEWIGDIPAELKQLASNTPSPFFKSGIRKINELSSTIYIHQIQPKPRLFVFGAGTDARPLVDFASKAGFSVHVIDWRPALCNKKYFPTADNITIGFPDEVMNQLSISSHDFVVILTHNFNRDKQIVSFLLNLELRYLGILGSRQRTKRLLGGEEIPSKITSPIGLNIDAIGAEQIAISVVAELIQLSNKAQLRGAISL
ncbi:XdhC family protein [Aquibacillus albus]|uniref:Xanthine/CO dehydrogenase XdhC/CoxF family maturation factor n=1 Tax=Aquibacillus albus TaxID=1168171 RepID=A0ABS2MZ04_9BACI|nr:XdhC family protein [Aquibacillus albus]MBM7571130.1 xanthine/CO dehydrogenase XdhC/CoxF family maturation factor [Aquibacillus albus]